MNGKKRKIYYKNLLPIEKYAEKLGFSLAIYNIGTGYVGKVGIFNEYDRLIYTLQFNEWQNTEECIELCFQKYYYTIKRIIDKYIRERIRFNF